MKTIKGKSHNSESQCQKVINWLIRPGRSLTRLQAFKKWGFMTLNSRVSNINAAGKYRIKSELIKLRSGARVAKYYMA